MGEQNYIPDRLLEFLITQDKSFLLYAVPGNIHLHLLLAPPDDSRLSYKRGEASGLWKQDYWNRQ